MTGIRKTQKMKIVQLLLHTLMEYSVLLVLKNSHISMSESMTVYYAKTVPPTMLTNMNV